MVCCSYFNIPKRFHATTNLNYYILATGLATFPKIGHFFQTSDPSACKVQTL
jgi:hypothetical protein